MPQQISHPITLIAQITRRLFRTAFRRNLLLVSGLVVVAVTVLYFARPARAANIVWSPPGADNNWSTGANWVGGVAPGTGDVAVFAGGSPNQDKNATIDVSINVAGIQINSTYSGTIAQATGSSVTLGSSGYSQAAGIFTGGSSAIDINGNLNLSGGTFNATAGSMSVSGNFIHSLGGTFTAGTGTVVFVGNNTEINANGETFNNLTFSLLPSIGKNLVTSTLNVNDTLNLVEGQVNNGTLVVPGTVSLGANFDGGTGTLALTGTATRTITLNSGAQMLNVNFNALNTTINTVPGSGTINWQAFTLATGAVQQGDFNFTFSGPYNQSSGSYTIGNGTFFSTNTGTNAFTQSNGTFNGGTGALNITGSFNLSGGTFNATTGNMSVSGNFIHSLGGTFNAGTGTVVFVGNNTEINANGETFNNLTFNLDPDVGKNLVGSTLNVNGTLNLAEGKVNNGFLVVPGTVSLGASFDGGTATLSLTGTATRTITLNSGAQMLNVNLNALNTTINTAPGSGTINWQTFTLVAGAVQQGDFNFTFSGAYNQSGGSYTIGNGTFATNSSFTQSNGTFNGGTGALNFNGNFNLSGGTFNATTGSMSVTGDFIHSLGGTFNAGTGTVVFVGNNTEINANGETFNNLTFNLLPDIGKNLVTSTLNVNGTLNLVEGQVNNGFLVVPGTVSLGASFDGGTATLSLTGTATRTITLNSGAQMLNVNLNALNTTINTAPGSGTINWQTFTLVAGAVQQGDFNFTFSGAYNQSGGSYTIGNGTFATNSSFTQTNGPFNGGTGALNFNGSFNLSGGTFNATTGSMSVTGDFIHSLGGTFNAGTGTVVFVGNNTEINANGETFNNLTFNLDPDVGKNLVTSTLNVNGTLNLVEGQANNGTLVVRGTVNLGASFDGGTVSINFAGSGEQTFSNSGGVNPTGTWTLSKPSGKVTLLSNLILQPGQQLNITSGILDQGASFNLTAGPIAIGAAGKLTNQGSGDLTLAGNISNAGTISINGGGGSCGDADSILIRSLPDGTQRTWSGVGNFFLTDVDVKDQAATNPITVFNGTDQPPGGPSTNPNFNFVAGCNPTAASARISGKITTQDGVPVSGAVIVLSGSQTRKTITDANGNYQFDEVGTGGFYTVMPLRVNYSFSPGARSFSQLGERSEAVFTALPTGGEANPLDTPEYFVRQHYLDFLGREPDESGFNFWSDQITSCGSDFACDEIRRINVSAAYFLSIEFQQTGGLVDCLYRASFVRRPSYVEFMPDTASVAENVIVGRGDWQQQLTTNKAAFIDAFVQRAAFRSVYDNLTDDSYVNTLIANTGVNYSQSERDTLVNGLTGGTLTRANVLRQVVENERFISAKFNQAFVLMQYFGYLRRDPDESGYQFWLAKLNQFEGNFERAEMVKAFIVSGEYRARFPR